MMPEQLSDQPPDIDRERVAAPVLSVCELTKSYDGIVNAVDGLSFSIARGEMFGLLGPNGAGKTTTIRMLTTRAVPTSGHILVNGTGLSGRESAYRSNIGVVSQAPTLDRSVSLWHGLYFHGRYHGMSKVEARRAAGEALELVNLTECGHRLPSRLSGGQTQRAMIARAVLHRPQLLFLDEPTAGLDPQSRRDLWSLLRALHADGTAILLTTHYMDEAFEICDRVGIMSHGRLAAIGRPTQLVAQFGGPPTVTVRLGEVSQLLARDLQTRFESVEFLGELEFRIAAKEPDDVVEAVMAVARQHGVTLQEAIVREPSLESAYLNLTSEKL
jgi:ABC-2 type transport system ATP-binding protein